jgi:dimethylaniline monooxygenase (N-oxide forming)
MPLHMRARMLRDLVLRTSGSPERFGALKPAKNIFEAGIAQSQYYLPLVAEGRIVPKPWIAAVEDQTVHFADGSAEKVDATIFGTGSDLHLPFLSEEIPRTLQFDSDRIELHHLTFHPDLANLAFVGLFPLIGPCLCAAVE